MADFCEAHEPREYLRELINKHECIRDYSIAQDIKVMIDGVPTVRTVITIDALLTESILPKEEPCQK